MNVLFVCHQASRTGAPIALLQVLLFMKKNCTDISFEILMLDKGMLLESFEELCVVHPGWRKSNVIVRVLRRLSRKRAEFPFLNQFYKGQFDLIYANSVGSFKAAIELKHKYNIPLVGHVHEAENALCAWCLTKEQVWEFDKFVAVSGLSKTNLVELFDVPENKILIQYPLSPWVCGLIENKEEISPANFLSESFVVGLFCNGNWWKATEMIPLVVKTFCERYPQADCAFCVVGPIDRLTRYQLEYDLRKMNVSGHVHWFGEVANPLEYLARFDIFLLLSREESFSLSAQEAAFLKKPIVGFEGVTGAAEWIKKGAGSLVPYMDFNRVSDEIYNYYANESLRKKVGDKAKEIVEEMYKSDMQMLNIVRLINSYGNNE